MNVRHLTVCNLLKKIPSRPLSLSLLLVACTIPQVNTTITSGQAIVRDNQVVSKTQQHNKHQVSGQAQVLSDNLSDKARLIVKLKLASRNTGFKTQALSPTRFQRVQAMISAPDISGNNPSFPNAILAEGADGDGYLSVTGDDEIILVFSDVPYGKARALYFGLDSSPDNTPLELAVIGTVFDLSTVTAEVEISYRTTPLYWLLATGGNQLLTPYRSGAFTLQDLQAFVDQISGKTGEGSYVYTESHPILINTNLLHNDLVAHNFDFSELNPADYRFVPGTIKGAISGLVSTDRIELRVIDPSSPLLSNQGNGNYLIPKVAVNDLGVIDAWLNFTLHTTVTGGTSYTVNYHPSEGVTLSSGTELTRNIELVPATPVLSTLSVNSGAVGDVITLTGNNFHANPDGNVVKFGEVTVPINDVTVVSANELRVKVPEAPFGLQPVMISVGPENSDDINFLVKKNITSKILFSTDAFTGHMEIYMMNPDGSSRIQLTNTQTTDALAQLSPDGTAIVFSSSRDGNGVFELYIMNSDGSNPRRLTNNGSINDIEAVWSPDGSKIAFRSNRDGNDEIYAMNIDGTNPIRLTNSISADRSPSWSPDGSKIAFQSNRDGNDEIYVMSVDGTNLVRLTNNTSQDNDPSWSPDGSKIVFHSNRDGNSEIYLMNADGSNQTRLTNNALIDGLPSWSPDGDKIIYSSAITAPKYNIYTMNLDGTNQTLISDFQNPSYSPYNAQVSHWASWTQNSP